MVKIGSLIRKGLEGIVAPVLIGASALLGSYQEAKAHTNDPSFYILYAQSDQVNWTNSATLDPSNSSIWKKDYTAYAPGYGGYTNNVSLNILVGFFIDTASVPPITLTNSMRVAQYSYNFDITKQIDFNIQKGIFVTNGVWQAKAMTDKIVDTIVSDYGDGYGYLDGNKFSITSAANSVAGNSLSSAIQISLNALQMQNNETLTFQPDSGNMTFGNSTTHKHYTANPSGQESIQIINSGSITFIPEPSTFALLGAGLPALLWRRKRQDNGQKRQ